MRCKWYLQSEPTEIFSEKPAFNVKPNRNPPNSHTSLEIFLSKLENEVFSVLPGTPCNYNLSKEEWLVIKDLAEECNIIIKLDDKGSCVVLWDHKDYLAESEKQLQDIFEDTDFKESRWWKRFGQVGRKSNTLLQSLRRRNLITERA